MFGSNSFLRKLSDLSVVPPTPPKTPSTISRQISDDDSRSSHSQAPAWMSVDDDNTVPSAPLKTLNLNTQRRGDATADSPANSPLPDDHDDSSVGDRTRRRRPKRPDMFGALSSATSSAGASLPTFRQSLYGLDASHAKRMEEIGRQRRLQSLQQQGESQADTEDDEPPPPKKSRQSEPLSFAADSLPTPPLDDDPVPGAVDEPAPDADIVMITKPVAPPKPPPESQSEDLKALENLLNETLSELQVAKDHAEELNRHHANEKRALQQCINDLEKQKTNQLEENTKQDQLIRELSIQIHTYQQQTSVLVDQKAAQLAINTAQQNAIKAHEASARKTQSELETLVLEKRAWQQKLDGMHTRLHNAERQLRCLDHVTRAKLDARQSGLLTSITRNPLFPKGLAVGTEIFNQVNAFNAWMPTVNNYMARQLVRSGQGLHTSSHSRAVEVLGDGISGLLQMHAKGSGPIKDTFVDRILEVFMIHWATMIIEAWYPKQQSFADILAELSAQKVNSRAAPRVHCGTPVKILTAQSLQGDFPAWTDDIIKDLKHILLLGGMLMPITAEQYVRRFILSPCVQKAYELRTSLAERDLSGHAELAVVAPDTMFQSKYMDNAYPTPATGAKAAAAQLKDIERVGGTCRLGLQISAPGQGSGSTSTSASATICLKPQVVLLRTIKESL